MPWCEPCEAYLTPNSVTTEGTCPSCGEAVAETSEAESDAFVGSGADVAGTPWHFKLLVGAAGAYLGWRAIQGIIWLVQQIG